MNGGDGTDTHIPMGGWVGSAFDVVPNGLYPGVTSVATPITVYGDITGLAATGDLGAWAEAHLRAVVYDETIGPGLMSPIASVLMAQVYKGGPCYYWDDATGLHVVPGSMLVDGDVSVAWTVEVPLDVGHSYVAGVEAYTVASSWDSLEPYPIPFAAYAVAGFAFDEIGVGVVPEPGSVFMLVGGLSALLVSRRRNHVSRR